MAIYIKGVELPKGDDCTILTVYSDGVVYLRQYKDRLCLEDSTNATSIPEPHGRLIDADELKHKIGSLPLDWEYGDGVKDCWFALQNTPTVIEGSE